MGMQMLNRRREQTRRRHIQTAGLSLFLLFGFQLSISAQNSPAPRQGVSPRGGTVAKPMSGEEVFRQFASLVLFITCELSPEEGKQGSGALVSADGLIATNAHVIEGCVKVTATYLNGTLQQSLDAKLKFYNHQTDTAIIKIDARNVSHFEVAQRAIRNCEHVFSIGNPQGFAQSITDGMVTGLRQFEGALWLQHSASTSAGSSGGALISS
jgi:serine protease Do